MADGVPFHNQVALDGFRFEDYHLTFNLTAGMTAADIGKAVSMNGANKVKLAADTDHIVGRLDVVEDRTAAGLLVGTVALKFIEELPIKTGEAVAVGNTVIGAGAGEVKAGVANPTNNIVVEVRGTKAVVMKI